MAKIDAAQIIEAKFSSLESEVKESLATEFNNALNTQFKQNMGLVDAALAGATGSKKPNGVLTTDWLKDTLNGYKTKAEEAGKEEIAAAKATITELQEKLKEAGKDGSGQKRIEQLEKELKDAKELAETAKAKIQEDAKGWQDKYTNLQKEVKIATIKAEANKFQFRDDIGEGAVKTLVEFAVDKLARLETEKDSEGRTVYRDENGSIMTNPNNGLAPFTTAELLQESLKDILKEGKQQTGAGTKGGNAGGGKGGVLSLNAKTQAEAMKQIEAHAFAQGHPQGSPGYQEIMDKAWTKEVQSLPAQ